MNASADIQLEVQHIRLDVIEVLWQLFGFFGQKFNRYRLGVCRVFLRQCTWWVKSLMSEGWEEGYHNLEVTFKGANFGLSSPAQVFRYILIGVSMFHGPYNGAHLGHQAAPFQAPV